MRHGFHSINLVLLATGSLYASERQFSYSQESAVLAPEQKELELWGTWKSGRLDYYRAFESRLEVEIGVADDVQTAVYLNHRSVTVDDGTNSGTNVTTSEFQGMSWEWKWRMSRIDQSSFGSALYLEGTVGSAEGELELKYIIDTRIGDHTVVANLIYEFESEFDAAHPEHLFQFTLGWNLRLSPRWSCGLELWNVNGYAYDGAEAAYELEYSVFYAGPVVHYGGPGFWATLSAMPQLWAPTRTAANMAVGQRLELDERERFNIRLLLGTDF